MIDTKKSFHGHSNWKEIKKEKPCAYLPIGGKCSQVFFSSRFWNSLVFILFESNDWRIGVTVFGQHAIYQRAKEARFQWNNIIMFSISKMSFSNVSFSKMLNAPIGFDLVHWKKFLSRIWLKRGEGLFN